MALKYKLTKEEFEKLNESLQGEYVEKGDGYVLDVQGADDGEELRRALENEKNNGREKGKKAADLEKQLADLQRENNRKNGNLEDIEADYKRQLSEKESGYQEQVKAMQSRIEKGLIDGHVNEIASKISKAPKLLAPHIRDRMSVEWEDNNPKLVIKDAEGKASSLKPEDLQKEFTNNEDFSAIIIGSKGSGGGGAPSGSPGVGGPVDQSQQSQKKLSDMSPQELAAHAKANWGESAEE